MKRSHPGQLMESIADDIEAEGDRQPITVNIPNFNVNNLRKFITNIQKNLPRYQITKNNCSHIVAECLRAATSKDPGFIPNAAAYGNIAKLLGEGIWTPEHVLRYARELVVNSTKR